MGKLQHRGADTPLGGSGPLLSNTETARLLGVTPHYLDNLRYRRQGPPFIRLTKRRVAYDPATLSGWLMERTVKGAERL